GDRMAPGGCLLPGAFEFLAFEISKLLRRGVDLSPLPPVDMPTNQRAVAGRQPAGRRGGHHLQDAAQVAPLVRRESAVRVPERDAAPTSAGATRGHGGTPIACSTSVTASISSGSGTR